VRLTVTSIKCEYPVTKTLSSVYVIEQAAVSKTEEGSARERTTAERAQAIAMSFVRKCSWKALSRAGVPSTFSFSIVFAEVRDYFGVAIV